MYIVGFIINSRGKVLFNPIILNDIPELYLWLSNKYKQNDFKNNEPMSIESIEYSLISGEPVEQWFAGVGSCYGILYGFKEKILRDYKIVNFRDYLV